MTAKNNTKSVSRKANRVGKLKTIFFIMRKLISYTFITAMAFFSMQSCSNTGTADSFPETVNQAKQSESKSSAKEAQKDPKEQMIFDEISGDLKGVGYGKEIEYTGKWKLLCHSPWGNSVGNACFETPIGNYNVHWQPHYYNTMPELQPSYDFNPIVFSGSWGCSC